MTRLRRALEDPRMLRGVSIALPAARLPPGLARDLAGFLPACVTLVRRLRRDPRRVPREALLGAWPGDPKLLLRLLGV